MSVRVAFAITVVGRVQGVGFRWYARDTAAGFRLAGWVENRKDGTVAIEVAGTADELEPFIAALRTGPSGAKVGDVRATRIDPARVADTGFEIRA